MVALELGDLAAWAAVLLSLYSIYRGEVIKSKTQKEARLYAQILDIKNNVNSLKSLTFSYWLNEDNGQSSIALEIKVYLKTISAKLTDSPELKSALFTDFAELRRVVSGGEFEVVGRPPLASNSAKMSRVANIFSDILQKINSL